MEESEIYSLAEKAIRYASKLGIDYADIRIQSADKTQFRLNTKEFEDTASGISFGAGMRVIHRGKLGFFSSNKPEIRKIVETALKLARLNPSEDKMILAPVKPVRDKVIQTSNKSVANVSIEEKRELARSVVHSAGIDPKITNVDVTYADSDSKSVFFSTEGAGIYVSGSKVAMGAKTTAKAGPNAETMFHAQRGFDMDALNGINEAVAIKASMLLKILNKKRPPSGNYDVVLSPQCAGTFMHEAIGHTVEADIVLQNRSALKDCMGKKVGSDAVNVSDASTLANQWGSFKYDDEGSPSQYTKIIENGVLKTFLHSRSTASKLNATPTGNARAENFASIPIVRMSNTFIEAGSYKFEELLSEIKNGYYLAGMSPGGQVSTLDGTFTFASSYAYKIEHGKLADIFRGCSFSGNILSVLPNIIAVCAEQEFQAGYCGKEDQMANVSIGKAHIAVKGLQIGGD